MTKVIVVTSGKGGVGKTTSSSSFASGLALRGHKTAVIDFDVQKNVLYKGKSTVTNGYFDFTFIVPKDINYSFGIGKISLYANV